MSGLKLNLGSGQRPFDRREGWINVDCQERWKPDVLADISQLPDEWEGQAEIVVLHHVLEHFGLTEGAALLKECYRVLAPGGRLLVFVPDQFALAQRWIKGQIDDYIYTVNLMGAYMGEEADRHKWGYCYRSLHKTLTGAGRLSRVMIATGGTAGWRWGSILGADIANDWWILGAEGVK